MLLDHGSTEPCLSEISKGRPACRKVQRGQLGSRTREGALNAPGCQVPVLPPMHRVTLGKVTLTSWSHRFLPCESQNRATYPWSHCTQTSKETVATMDATWMMSKHLTTQSPGLLNFVFQLFAIGL